MNEPTSVKNDRVNLNGFGVFTKVKMVEIPDTTKTTSQYPSPFLWQKRIDSSKAMISTVRY